MSLFSSSKNEKKQEPKKINIQDLIEDNKALSENLSLDETPTISESELVETPIILESEPVDLNETPIEVKDTKVVPAVADAFETKAGLLAPSKEIFSEEELSFASVAGEDSPETTSSNEDFFDEISPKEKEINDSEDSSVNKTNDFFEDLKDSTAKSNVVKVPRVFLNWFEKADKNATVFEAYSLVDLEDDSKLKDWVKENQNIFAKIWLGDVIPELELEFYMTSIPNYDGKLPNVLVRTEEGKYVIKTSEDILASDELRLTEQEILKDWEYLFTNGFSELLD